MYLNIRVLEQSYKTGLGWGCFAPVLVALNFVSFCRKSRSPTSRPAGLTASPSAPSSTTSSLKRSTSQRSTPRTESRTLKLPFPPESKSGAASSRIRDFLSRHFFRAIFSRHFALLFSRHFLLDSILMFHLHYGENRVKLVGFREEKKIVFFT